MEPVVNGGAVANVSRYFAFGPYLLGPERQLLLQDGVPVRIGGRALDILTALVERPGELVTKRELMARVWPDAVVEDDNLKVNMVALRRILGDDAGAAKYIATVTGRGYRFIASVQAGRPPGLAVDSSVAAAHSGFLPTGSTRIFGRAEAIAGVRRDLDEARVVSIVGAGGIGKTTIAVAASHAAARECADGAGFIDLATISDPQFVPGTIASMLGLAVTGEDPLSTVVHALKLQRKLLLIDNCEHLLPAVSAAVDRLASQLAGVRILTTSREPLRIRGERVYRLRGLECGVRDGATADEARKLPAVELFAARALERAGYQLTGADAPAAAEICRRLEGNALAIELAATQTASFSPLEILQMLDSSFRLLNRGPPGAPLRQQSLLATLDWSYGLLSESEAALLRAVAVFAGAFSVDGATAVSKVAPAEVVDALAQLAAKSLLVMDATDDLVTYRLLETTRAYCLERLRVSSEDDVIRHRHSEQVCAVLERAAAEWDRRSVGEWDAVFGRVVDDLRGALSWAGRDAAPRSLLIRLTSAGILLWNHLLLTEECRRHVARAIEELDAAGQAGTAVEMHLQMSLAGTTLFARGIAPQVMHAMRRALDIAVQLGDNDTRLRCLRTIAASELFSGQHEAGLRTLESCASFVAATDNASGDPTEEGYLAIGELFVGQLQSAKRRLERLYRPDVSEFNDSRVVRFLAYRNVDAGSVLSHAQWLTGSPDTAARTAAAMIDNALKSRYWYSVTNCISWACPVFFLSGRLEECRDYVEMLEEHVLRHGVVVRRPVVVFYRGALACQQQDVPKEGIDDLTQGIEEFRAVNYLARMPFYLGLLADALNRSGRLGDAETKIRAALDCAAAQGERWCIPELLRIRASILVTASRLEDAEMLLADSMAAALEIEAPSWRLRAANDLAKLWCRRSRADDVRRMLLPIYNEFSEGFATHDLVVASDLLASLSHPGETSSSS
jgi:predicted ATPase/DNA-binding winged helix-turn-helix (wHTH) protein